MQAVILAGGLGTRLGDLTRTMPKAMMPFQGRPFLQYTIGLLKEQGIVDIVICAGYLGEQIRDFFNDGHEMGLDIKYSKEGEKLLGTGGALRWARDMLEGYFLVLNGDTYLPIDYLEAEDVYLQLGKKALMVVYDNKVDTGVRNNIALDNDKMVVRYDKKGLSPELSYVEAGALIFRKELLELIPEGVPGSLEDGIYGPLIEEREMAAHIVKQRFYDIGTPERQKVFKGFAKRESG
jgi:NDP-sugar pyrophosphorylase family protein